MGHSKTPEYRYLTTIKLCCASDDGENKPKKKNQTSSPVYMVIMVSSPILQIRDLCLYSWHPPKHSMQDGSDLMDGMCHFNATDPYRL